jgi:acetyl esterase
MNNPYLVLPERSVQQLFSKSAIGTETQLVTEQLSRTLAAMKPPADLAHLRQAYVDGALGVPASPKSPRARTMTIEGPSGPIELRILVPDDPKGIYLHIHGGGWMVGSNDTWDDQLELFGREAAMIAVSPNYRLAPEHPFPAANEDCLAVAEWLIDHSQEVFGISWLSIGGESAGSNLAASTLIQLRNRGKGAHFRAANLLFGCYDLALTPGVRMSTDSPFVNHESMKQFVSAFAGYHDLYDPLLSPLYSDLSGLPPALFSVGSVDPLADDSLFMHSRWQTAGNAAHLAIYPGGIHGFNSFDHPLARAANLGMAHFLKGIRAQDV